jgi:GNAT superfamily N-acetyltransferase
MRLSAPVPCPGFRRVVFSLNIMAPGSETSIALLADHPDLVARVGELRWREWGHGQTSREEWVEITARESGRDELPVTLVALDVTGSALGAVGLGLTDNALTDEERRLRQPWLLGLIVRSDRRSEGVGGRLVAALESLTRDFGFADIWVATGNDAVGFYQRCGWTVKEQLVLTNGGWPNYVLTRHL